MNSQPELAAPPLLGCPFCGAVPTLPATDKMVCCTNQSCEIYGRHMRVKTWNARFIGQTNDTFDQIKAILGGIDKDEVAADYGWWETTEGAEFGAKKLTEIKALFYPPNP